MSNEYDKFKGVKSPKDRIERGSANTQNENIRGKNSDGEGEKLDRLKRLYQSLNPEDQYTQQSLKEIEQEEFVTNLLRQQREKLEYLRDEFRAKEDYCLTLEDEIDDLKRKLKNSSQYQELYEETLFKLKQYELEVEKAKAEKDIFAESTGKYQSEISYWKKECEKQNRHYKASHEELKELKKSIQEKEAAHKNQLSIHIENQVSLKDEIKFLKNELSKSNTYIDELKEKNGSLEHDLKKHNKLERAVDEYRKELQEQKKMVDKLIQENNAYEKENKTQQKILSEQDLALRELNHRLKEDDLKLKHLREENSAMSQRISKLDEDKKKLLESFNESAPRIKDLEKEVKRQRHKNHELKQEIGKLLERDQHEKRFREELERAKNDVVSVRNKEVQKLYETFENLFGNTDTEPSKRNTASNYEKESTDSRVSRTDVSFQNENIGMSDKKIQRGTYQSSKSGGSSKKRVTLGDNDD